MLLDLKIHKSRGLVKLRPLHRPAEITCSMLIYDYSNGLLNYDDPPCYAHEFPAGFPSKNQGTGPHWQHWLQGDEIHWDSFSWKPEISLAMQLVTNVGTQDRLQVGCVPDIFAVRACDFDDPVAGDWRYLDPAST